MEHLCFPSRPEHDSRKNMQGKQWCHRAGAGSRQRGCSTTLAPDWRHRGCLHAARDALIALVGPDHHHDCRQATLTDRSSASGIGSRPGMRREGQQEQQSTKSESRTKTDNCCGPQIQQKGCPAIGTVSHSSGHGLIPQGHRRSKQI